MVPEKFCEQYEKCFHGKKRLGNCDAVLCLVSSPKEVPKAEADKGQTCCRDARDVKMMCFQ
jgi:hypothetical protein